MTTQPDEWKVLYKGSYNGRDGMESLTYLVVGFRNAEDAAVSLAIRDGGNVIGQVRHSQDAQKVVGLAVTDKPSNGTLLGRTLADGGVEVTLGDHNGHPVSIYTSAIHRLEPGLTLRAIALTLQIFANEFKGTGPKQRPLECTVENITRLIEPLKKDLSALEQEIAAPGAATSPHTHRIEGAAQRLQS